MFQKKRTKFYVHIDRNETEMCVEWNYVANKTQVYTRDRRTDRQANVTDGRTDGNLQQAKTSNDQNSNEQTTEVT